MFQFYLCAVLNEAEQLIETQSWKSRIMCAYFILVRVGLTFLLQLFDI